MNEKNALKELARLLRNGLYINPNDERFDGPVIVRTLDANDVLAAQRIIAELANADLAYANDPVSNNCVELRLDAFKKCRAIAEEGETK